MPSHQGSNSVCSSPASCISGNPSSPAENGGQKTVRQRLKPWLEKQVDSGRHPGVYWIDKAQGIFRITWKHHGRSDWCEENGSIFKAWAEHTGKYTEGKDNKDWPTWKTRLRCAINKQKPDIEEIKELSCSEEPDPYRVFQFTYKRESASNSPSQADSAEPVPDPKANGFRYPVQNRPSVIQTNGGNIPTVISDSLDTKPSIERNEECGVDAEINSLGSDLRGVSITDLVPTSGISMTNISIGSASNININAEAMDTDSLKDGESQHRHQSQNQSVKMEPQEKGANPSYFQIKANDYEMQITLRFRNEVILQKAVTTPYGCRVFYGQCTPEHGMWDPEMFGSEEAEQIMVPFSPGQFRSAQQEEYTRKVLDGFELGISMYMDNLRNIYFKRRCKTRIITAPANKSADHSTKKMERHEQLKVFDFTGDFLPAFQRYERGEGPRPSPQVIVAVGQDFHTDVEPYTNLFFSVTVCHAQASDLLSQFTASTSGPEMSHSDQFDYFMNLVRVVSSPTTPTPAITNSPTFNHQIDEAIPQPVYHDNAALM